MVGCIASFGRGRSSLLLRDPLKKKQRFNSHSRGSSRGIGQTAIDYLTKEAAKTALLVRESTVEYLQTPDEPNAEELIEQETPLHQWHRETQYPR